MAIRAMNNEEKQAAKLLKEAGFHVFFQYHRATQGEWWATHPKLIMQYHVPSAAAEALDHLKNKIAHRHAETLQSTVQA